MVHFVKVDVFSEVEEIVTQNHRALAWITNKSFEERPVSIGQLASYLKLKKEQAIDVVKRIIDNRAKLSGDDRTLIVLWVFVENGQMPKWLRALLTPTDVARVLNAAKNRAAPSVGYMLEYRRLLHLQPNFREQLTTVWTDMRDATFKTLHKAGLINADILVKETEQPVTADWMDREAPIWGNNYSNYSYSYTSEGTNVLMEYARSSKAQLNSLNFDRTQYAKIRCKEQPRNAIGNLPTPGEAEGRRLVVQDMIRHMASHGYQLHRLATRISQNFEFKHMVHRNSLVFLGDSGLGEVVYITLPWENTLFKIEK